MAQHLKLGLVCISEELRKAHRGAYKTMTRKSFLSGSRESSLRTLSSRVLANTQYLHALLQHIRATAHIHNGSLCHIRLSSALFPLITEPSLKLSYDDLPDIAEIRQSLHRFGQAATEAGISISSHPDQFNVLASYRQDVVDKSVQELNHQAAVMDMIGLPQSAAAPLTLHVACSPRVGVESVPAYVERFLHGVSRCDLGVRSRLVLENEDKGYWSCENLYDMFAGNFPLVYDNLHDSCNPSERAEDWPQLFAATWRGETPVFHWSEGIGNSNKHTARASHIPAVVQNNPSVVWEVELKDKDSAIFEICGMLA